jgi:hypothetical protein
MAKISITHEFNRHEEKEEFKILMNASLSYGILWDLDQKIRSKIKYGEDEWLNINGIQEFLEEIRSDICESGIFRDE